MKISTAGDTIKGPAIKLKTLKCYLASVPVLLHLWQRRKRVSPQSCFKFLVNVMKKEPTVKRIH